MDVTVDGKRAHAATGSRQGNADEPAVVLVHGSGLDRTIWQMHLLGDHSGIQLDCSSPFLTGKGFVNAI